MKGISNLLRKTSIAFRVGAIAGLLLIALVITNVVVIRQMDASAKRVMAATDMFDELEAASGANRQFGDIRYWLTDLAGQPADALGAERQGGAGRARRLSETDRRPRSRPRCRHRPRGRRLHAGRHAGGRRLRRQRRQEPRARSPCGPRCPSPCSPTSPGSPAAARPHGAPRSCGPARGRACARRARRCRAARPRGPGPPRARRAAGSAARARRWDGAAPRAISSSTTRRWTGERGLGLTAPSMRPGRDTTGSLSYPPGRLRAMPADSLAFARSARALASEARRRGLTAPAFGARPGSRVPTARCGVSPVAGRSWRSASGAGGSTRWWPTSSTAWSRRTGCPAWRPSACGRHSCRPVCSDETRREHRSSAAPFLSSAAVLTAAAHDKKRCRARLPSAGGRGPTGRGRALKTPSVRVRIPPSPDADNEIGLLEVWRRRLAIRRLRPDPVSTDDLATVLFSATRARLGSNRQHFRFVVLRDGPGGRAKALLGDGFRRMWAEKRAADRYSSGSGADDASPKARMARTMQRFVDGFEQTPVVVLACVWLAIGRRPRPRACRCTRPARTCCWRRVPSGSAV